MVVDGGNPLPNSTFICFIYILRFLGNGIQCYSGIPTAGVSLLERDDWLFKGWNGDWLAFQGVQLLFGAASPVGRSSESKSESKEQSWHGSLVADCQIHLSRYTTSAGYGE